MEKKLTPRQELFVSEYLKSGNAADAARKAGYKERYAKTSARQLLQNTTVSRALEARRARRNATLELEEDFELKKAVELLNMCMKPEQVVDMFGKPVVDKETGKFVMSFDSKGANTALQTIAKLRGKFVTKVDVGMADGIAELIRGVKL